jgi:hypothetical protein
MEHSERDIGTMHVLLERLTNERLPRLVEIKARVDEGNALADHDIDFLEHALNNANENAHLYLGFPEYHDIAGKVVAIYHEITTKALENEKHRQA